MNGPVVNGFTERQAEAWPEAIADAQRHVTSSTIGPDLNGHWWTVEWVPESRPGRGCDLNAIWTDGEHFVQIMMDVYGRASVSVASLDWLHADADEDCPCDNCVSERSDS